MKKIIKNLLNVFLVLITVFSFYKVYEKLNDYKKADNTYSNLEEIYENNLIEESSSITDTSENKDILSNNNTQFNNNNLYSINNDFKFWIKVDNTNISYPVVQGNDNSFYLKNDFYKKKSSSGTIFIDYQNNYKEDKNVVIYGHNMKNKTMFANLEKFKDKSFFNQSNKIRIVEDGTEYIYEVFSVYYTNANNINLIYSFDNDLDFIDYINILKNKSLFKSNLTFDNDDKIITLSTCNDDNSGRKVVHAKLVN